MRSILRPIAFSVACLALITSFAAAAPKARTPRERPHVAREHAPALKLIPTPRYAYRGAGSFSFASGVGIVLADPARADDRFAAGQLTEEVGREMGLKLGLATSPKRPIFLGLATDPTIAAECKARRVRLDDRIGEEGYVLYVGADSIVVAANTTTGVFYGVQTLKQLIRANRVPDARGAGVSPASEDGPKRLCAIPCVRIRDWPGLRYRGYSDDISRGPIPTMEFFKRQIHTMAEFKMNMLTFYTEHVFKIKGHPLIAPEDGLTTEQVLELTACAKQHHVELVGNFQSFGHFYNILRHDEYKECRENMGVLSPAKEETYKLLSDIYDSIVPAYGSKLFNVNCDETYGLGEGPAKDLVAKIGVGGVYLMHMKRVHDMLAARGKRMMMWGDIALQHPDIIVAGLPRDTILLSWGYGASPNYDSAIVPFKKVGFEFMVCPGVSCWSQIFPNYDNAIVNIHNYVRDGAKFGALGMLNTTWDDDGENLFTWNFYGTNWGAQCAWRPEASEIKDYDAAWSQVSYGTKSTCADEAVKLLTSCVNIGITRGLSDPAFWEAPFGPLTASLKATERQATELRAKTSAAIRFLEQGKREATLDARDLDYLLFSARRLKFMADCRLERLAAAREYEKAITPPARAAAAKTALQSALTSTQGLHATLTGLRGEYKRLWDLENRPYSRDGILGRYDGFAQSFVNQEKGLETAIGALDKTGMFPDVRPLGLEITETGSRNTKAMPASQALLPANAPWWDHGCVYRLPLRIEAGNAERVDCPVEVRLNFGSLAKGVDAASVRLMEYKPDAAPATEVPCQLDLADKTSGNLVFLMPGRTAANASRVFVVYFNETGGGPVPPGGAALTWRDLRGIRTAMDARGAWVENARYRILLGREGAHLHVWEAKALGNADITDPGETSYHGFADSGFADRDAQFDLKCEAKGPLMVRYRCKSQATGTEKILTFFAGLPWVEVALESPVSFYWDYDNTHTFASDTPTPGTAIFSNGHTEPVAASSAQIHNVGNDTTWCAKFRADGFLLGNLTPEVATTHMVGPGGGWGGVGVEGGNAAGHFVTYADKTDAKPADVLNALQRTLDFRNQVRMVFGSLEKAGG